MTQQTLPLNPFENPPFLSLAPSFTSTAFAATGDKAYWLGRFRHKDRTSKNISRVGFRFGSVTIAGGSGLTVSLQDVSLTAGPVARPDGTQDQTVAVASGSIVANTWLRTGALSATRTIAPDDLVAVVVEFDGGGRLGADSIGIGNLATPGSSSVLLNHQGFFGTEIGGVFASSAVIPNIVLECDDGTFGTIQGALPCSSSNTHSYKQDTATNDEFALAFQVPFPCTIDSFWAAIATAASTSNFNFVLYEGTTAVSNGTVSIDANSLRAATGSPLDVPTAAGIVLSANTQYFLAINPTQTTSNVSVYSFDVADADILDCWPGGIGFSYAYRLNSGAWKGVDTNNYSHGSSVNTRRLLAGLGFAGADDATGGGGGLAMPVSGGICT